MREDRRIVDEAYLKTRRPMISGKLPPVSTALSCPDGQSELLRLPAAKEARDAYSGVMARRSKRILDQVGIRRRLAAYLMTWHAGKSALITLFGALMAVNRRETGAGDSNNRQAALGIEYDGSITVGNGRRMQCGRS